MGGFGKWGGTISREGKLLLYLVGINCPQRYALHTVCLLIPVASAMYSTVLIQVAACVLFYYKVFLPSAGLQFRASFYRDGIHMTTCVQGNNRDPFKLSVVAVVLIEPKLLCRINVQFAAQLRFLGLFMRARDSSRRRAAGCFKSFVFSLCERRARKSCMRRK